MRLWPCVLSLTITAAFSAMPVPAQDPDKPLAVLRQTAGTDNYFIRVQTNAKLPADSKLSAILTNKSSLVTWEEEVKDCTGHIAGQFCKQLESGLVVMNYDLAARPQPADRFKVSFAISDKSGRGSFRSVDLITDFKSAGPRADLLCRNGLIIDFQADNTSLEMNESEKEYYRSRLIALNRWLRLNRAEPAKMAAVRIEPLTKSTAPEYSIRTFSVSPSLDADRNPQELDIEQALSSQNVLVCLEFEEALPTEKFNAQVAFRNTPPLELDKPLTKVVIGPKAIATPVASKIPDENKLGLRSLDNNLELGLMFTSSVKETKVNNIPTRQRQSRGSFDLRFAPLLRGRMRPPEVKKWQPFWTPLFFDAKISTGKVSEDTLSLNRVLIGTEIAFRRVEGTKKGDRNKFIVTLRGTNASDRDFKVAEAKGEFEFRPIFESLNQPLRIQRTATRSILIPDGPPKEISSGGFFGYQIQPFIGFEAGRVYRRSRTAFKTEAQQDNVRRLILGIDVALNLTTRFSLSFTDIFYLRGETPSHRTRNYFSGTIEAPVGNFSRNASQSIFFSFEKGNQPPFVTPAVNAFKFGYRVRSDFFESGAAP